MAKSLAKKGLPPAFYGSPEVLETERQQLLLKSWQWAGLVDDLGPPGGLTTDIAGVPIAIEGDVADLRVCLNGGHRRERITGADVAACGRFIFVRLKGGGPDLTTYLGDHAALLQHCTDAFEDVYHRNCEDWECNWKAGLEVTLEGYHVKMVHDGSNFSDAVPDSLPPEFSGPHSYQCGLTSDQMRSEMASISKRLKIEPSKRYSNYDHFTLFPNMTVGISGGCLCFMQIYTPLTPNRTRLRYAYMMAKLANPAILPVAAIKAALLDKWRDYTRTVLKEDQLACERFQKGVAFATHPALIGLRAEGRIAHFHKHWREAMASDEAAMRKSA